MKLLPYRKLVKADGKVTQKDLFRQFILTKQDANDDASKESGVQISENLVPRLVNPRQYNAINLRRRVRSCIEKARIDAGLPIDGSRPAGGFKYLQRHIIASQRARAPSGTFLKVSSEAVPSISN